MATFIFKSGQMATFIWPLVFSGVFGCDKNGLKMAKWPLFAHFWEVKVATKSGKKRPKSAYFGSKMGVFGVFLAVFGVLWPNAHFYF